MVVMKYFPNVYFAYAYAVLGVVVGVLGVMRVRPYVAIVGFSLTAVSVYMAFAIKRYPKMFKWGEGYKHPFSWWKK